MYPLTKIVATLGPASENEPMLRKLIEAGMNVARINCSHGSWDERKEKIQLVRKVSREMNVSVAILVDIQGPKIRTGDLPEAGVELTESEVVTLVTDEKDANWSASPKKIHIRNYPELPEEVSNGQRILLDDGMIRMQVESTSKKDVTAKVTVAGILKSNKGVNLPESEQLKLKAITDKDREDIKGAVACGADYIALSFVRHRRDIQELKSLIEEAKPSSPIKVIAKIEKPQAVDQLDEILDETDAVMVARGDLGVELEPEQVPIIQKKIISEANRKNVIVITATQMMESMINNPFPTRAEVSDVANAIIDGTDAVMLSGETAVGKYPVEAVNYMRKIALEVESKVDIYTEKFDPAFASTEPNKVAIARGVKGFVKLDYLDIKNIVSFSCSGSSVRVISKLRPNVRIIAATTYQHTYNYLAMVWGVTPVFFDGVDHTTTTIANLEEQLIKEGYIESGETIVLTGGLPIAARSDANFIKLHHCNAMMREQSKLERVMPQSKDLGPKMTSRIMA